MAKSKINVPLIREWVKALRSKKYKQSHGQLRADGGYCCLGVLCDLVKDRVGGEWDCGDFVVGEHRGHCVLPGPVVALAGLPDDNPTVGEKSLAEHNDGQLGYPDNTFSGGKSFREIADLVERRWLKKKAKAK